MGKVSTSIEKGAAKFSGKLGKGLLAGLAGTTGMTAVQMIEMKISGRKMSSTPAIATEKVLGIEPSGKKDQKEKNQTRLANIIHFIYGTSWGAATGLLALAGVKGIKAAAIHFGTIWGTGMIMLPALKVAPPVKKWGTAEILKDAVHHAIYTAVAGFVFNKLNKVKVC